MPDAVASTNFNVELKAGDTLCWLPLPGDMVDDEVQELAQLVDRSVFLPTRVVMLSIAGTADDASLAQAEKWYGEDARAKVMMHQYAIKMIDELELPYTIVRIPPLTDRVTSAKVVDEGQTMTGGPVGVAQVVTTLQTVLATDRYRNQSIGIINDKGGQWWQT